MPIFQSIYLGLVQIKNNIPAYDKIEKELFGSKMYNIENKNTESKKIELKDEDSIVLDNLSFSYENNGKKVVEKINIKIKKNSLNFIVGASGSGKSTILDLLLGLIFPNDGSIKIGNENLNKNNANIWHQNIGYVGQNIFLLDDTIKNNICLFSNQNDNIDEDRLNKALKLSYVENFLNNLPDGINTIVGERGLKLSGGQRQRVAIARALYQQKNFLIFDEATASLDGIAEKFIIDQLKKLSEVKTIIMVTHNLKLCRDADIIYLLDQGKIKEFGKYNNLIKNELFLKLLNDN